MAAPPNPPSRPPSPQLQTLLDTFVDGLQPPPAAPLPAAPSHPGNRLLTPAQGRSRRRPRPRHPRPRPHTTASTTSGSVTLRVNGRLHHIGIGRTHARTHVLLLVQDLDVRIVHAATGELLRELTIDPNRDYQPTGAPKGPTRKPNDHR
ncbi:MAG: hypothetical protein WKF82_10075 [Nocardioidaceae bacterium]